MTDFTGAQVQSPDAIGFWEDAGLVSIINTLMRTNISFDSWEDFVGAVNFAVDPMMPKVGSEMLYQFIGDVRDKGEFLLIDIVGIIEPIPITRFAAPDGIGGSHLTPESFWFSTPDIGTAYLWGYKNGAIVYQDTSPRDLSANRGLGDVANSTSWVTGDAMQLALMSADNPPTGGWWGKYIIP